MNFARRLDAAAAATDRILKDRLTQMASDGLSPERLVEATRYALLGGGKRFRPFLVIEAARLCAHEGDAAVSVGAAFECLHAYSLVHDDLPAMDDDDLRRGRPTVHKAFDEATAILVGDGLQTLAFEIITDDPVPRDASGPLALLLARAAGIAGMVGGQYRDLNAIGLDIKGIRLMQSMKTGALIRAACEAGAILAGAGEEERLRLRHFGEKLGEAFQLADDLLDLEGDEAVTGKRVGKDAAVGKATLPQMLGIEAAKARLAEVVAAAGEDLAPWGERADILREAARFVAERQS